MNHPCFAEWERDDIQMIASESRYRTLGDETVLSDTTGSLILVSLLLS